VVWEDGGREAPSYPIDRVLLSCEEPRLTFFFARSAIEGQQAGI
jgi:hypothetical protein